MTIKTVNRKRFKITVEDLSPRYLATYWDKEMEYEVDRKVFEFETYGGACDKALDLLDDATKRERLKNE